MKPTVLFTFCLLFLLNKSNAQESDVAKHIASKGYNPTTFMWYRQPATQWDDALPVGNGRLGGMVFGGIIEERIQLNEDTYWSGGPYSTVVKGGYKHLPEIQRLVFEGKMLKAHNLFGRQLMGYPVEQQKYQSLANLHLFFPEHASASNYVRWLDLNTGVTGVQYEVDGVQFQRETFASTPDQLIVVKITASKPGSISFKANLRGVRNRSHSNYAYDYIKMDGLGSDGLVVSGKSADYMGVAGKLKYECRLKVVNTGGIITVDDEHLMVKEANTVYLYISAATNFVNYKDVSGKAVERNDVYLLNGLKKNYAQLKSAHITDHQHYFNRVSLTLPTTTNTWKPTDQRLSENVSHSDPSLAALAYQFGRYVLITSSRPGTQAANLQGIWNNDMNPAWDAKYTTNINTEMNYWAVQSANLSEMALPLVDLVREASDQGAEVAKEHYGAGGWVLHQNTDLWRVAAPMDGPTWGTFTTAGAWLCTQLWEQFLFTRDTNYLRTVYPLIKGSVEFFMDFLVPHQNGQWLVTNPSTSPENFPAGLGNGPYFDEVTGGERPGTTICAGSTIDMQILTDLFGYFSEASSALQMDKAFATKVLDARKRFPPPQIGRDGALQEWSDDWGQLEEEHRHASHMYGLFPGNVISVEKTPAFIDACKAVLEQRGDGATGWSRAWKTNLWARLNDGDRANKILKLYFKEQSNIQLFGKCGRPMQVDATLGVCAGVSEMLLQSQEGIIRFLPALPQEWESGRFTGACARGAFELGFEWKKNILTNAVILSQKGGDCRVKISGQKIKVSTDGKFVKYKKLTDGSISFSTKAKSSYIITIEK